MTEPPRTTSQIAAPNGATRLYPIVGDPIDHVQSPERLSLTFNQRGVNALCVPLLVREGDLADVLASLQRVPSVSGFLVTMPHKRTAAMACATLSERSQWLGAVSVIRRNLDQSWHGDMLDGIALVEAQVRQGARPLGAKVLLVGLGSAGAAIAGDFLEAGVRELVVHDRLPENVERFLSLLPASDRERVVVGPPDPTGCDLACNATPLGMNPSDPLPLDTEALTKATFVGDVVSGHGITRLIAEARAKGCPTATGGAMVEAVQDAMVEFFLS